MTATLPSLEKLRPNAAWAKLPLFDRKQWRTLPFGRFAESIGERVEPADAADEIYVGLDDLDSGDLHIKRWGKGSDVTGTKLRFRKGDIIFGRRRAYQRKLAVAEFDGICSAHAMVVRAKPELVLPDFLPFLMISDSFMKRAVEISVGSLSPTINWKTMKFEEFALPPLDQQRRISEVLWAVNDSLTVAGSFRDKIHATRRAFFEDSLRKGTEVEPRTLRKLGDALVGIVAGKSPKSSSSVAADGEYGVLKVSAVGNGEYCEYENKALLDQKDFVREYEVTPGMILVTRCNALLSGIGRACLVKSTRRGLMLCDKTLQLVPDHTIIERDFLLFGLQCEPYRSFVERSANGTEAKNITQETIKAAPFWIPELAEQSRVVAKLMEFGITLAAAKSNSTRLCALRDALVTSTIA
jgi:restriction endonuclease S subunit